MIKDTIIDENLEKITNLKIYAENAIGEKYKLKFVVFYKNSAINVKEYYYDKIYSLYADLFIFLESKNLLVYESTTKLNDLNQNLDSKDDLFNVSISEYLEKKYLVLNNKTLTVYFWLNDSKCLIDDLSYIDERENFKEFIEQSIKSLRHIKVNFNKDSICSMLTHEDINKRNLYRNINQMLKEKQAGVDIYTKPYGELIAGLSNFEYEYVYNLKKIKLYLNTYKKIIIKSCLNFSYNKINDEEIKVYTDKDSIDDIYTTIKSYMNRIRKGIDNRLFLLKDNKEKILIIYLRKISEDYIKNIKQSTEIVEKIRNEF